jgi:imidazolonepropionase-like amidohydrolase
MTEPGNNSVLLTNFALLDTEAGVLRSGYQALIEGKLIARLERGAINAPGVRTADLGGRTLMPGMIDCHVHLHSTTLPPAPIVLPSLITARMGVRLRDMLMRGFTTVRDAAGADVGHRQAVEQGLFLGPRLFVSGRAISQTGGHGDPRSPADQREPCSCIHLVAGIGRIADGVTEVRKAVRDEIRLGADQIKVMAAGGVGTVTGGIDYLQYSREELEAIVDEAVRAGTYVMSHVYTSAGIRRCVEAGIRTIEHGSFLDEETAALMAARGAFLSPNLVIYDIIANRGLQHGWAPASVLKAKEVLESGSRAMQIAKRAGVKMSFGTDLSKTPEAMCDEIIARAAFQEPADIIRSLTAVGAEVVRMAGRIGVVGEGAIADLLVVDGDPLSDIRLLTGDGFHFPVILKEGAAVKDGLGVLDAAG